MPSAFKVLPNPDDGLPNYFRAALENARRDQLELAGKHTDPEVYQHHLTILIDSMFSQVFCFGVLYSGKDHFSGSAPNLRAVHKFLSELFLPGGPFHGGVVSKINYQPNEILWAPMAHLILSHPQDTKGLGAAIWFRMVKGFLNCTEETGTIGQQRFECDLNLLCNRIGFVEHRPWIHQLMETLPSWVQSQDDLSDLIGAGGLDGLLRWKVDINAILASGLKVVQERKLDYYDYGRLVLGALGLLEYLEKTDGIDPVTAQQRRGVLLQTGLESWVKAPKKNEPDWRRFINRVIDSVNPDLTPAQLVTYLHFATTAEQRARAFLVLENLQPEKVVEAIRSVGTEREQVALIRELGLEAVIPQNEWLQLLGSAFGTDLGL